MIDFSSSSARLDSAIQLAKGLLQVNWWLKQCFEHFFVCPFFLKALKLRRTKIWIQLIILMCFLHMRKDCKYSFKNPLGRIIKGIWQKLAKFGSILPLWLLPPAMDGCLSSCCFSLEPSQVPFPGVCSRLQPFPPIPAGRVRDLRERWAQPLSPSYSSTGGAGGWGGLSRCSGYRQHRAPLVNAIFDRSHCTGGIFTAPGEDKTPGAGM